MDRFVAALVRFVKAAVLIFGLFVVIASSSGSASNGGIYVGIAIGAVGLYSLYRPLPRVWIFNRFIAGLLVFLAMTPFIVDGSKKAKEVKIREEVAQETVRIAELRKTNADAYLAAIAPTAPNGFFLLEARELLRARDPQDYLRTVRPKMDKNDFLEEMKLLDPAAYQAEVVRWEAEKRAEEEARAAAVETERASLLEKLKGVKSLPLVEQLQLYDQLVQLSPENPGYKKEATRLGALVAAAEKKQREKEAAEEHKAALQRIEDRRKGEARANPLPFLEIVKFSWSKGGFGSVMEATFVVENAAPIDVKDIEITCEHSAASGTVIDSNTRTIYDIVKANSTRTFRSVNMGFIHSQAARSGCEIVSASPVW